MGNVYNKLFFFCKNCESSIKLLRVIYRIPLMYAFKKNIRCAYEHMNKLKNLNKLIGKNLNFVNLIVLTF